MKTEMERKMDQLNLQLHYWQNVTVNILNGHCSLLSTGIIIIKTGIYMLLHHSNITTTWYPNISKGPTSSLDTVLMSTVFNITHNSKYIFV